MPAYDKTMSNFATLDELIATINARKNTPADASYTAQLLAKGTAKIAQKLGEEATETVIAAMQGDKAELAKESADLLYHLCVLWADQGITPQQVMAVLQARQGQSGLEEKHQRKPSS